MTELRTIASQYGVSVEVIAIRWIIDQGLIPIVPITFSSKPKIASDVDDDDNDESESKKVKGNSSMLTAASCWDSFGTSGHLKSSQPGYDPRLIMKESFLLHKVVCLLIYIYIFLNHDHYHYHHHYHYRYHYH